VIGNGQECEQYLKNHVRIVVMIIWLKYENHQLKFAAFFIHPFYDLQFSIFFGTDIQLLQAAVKRAARHA
jgi:hypothetical protein